MMKRFGKVSIIIVLVVFINNGCMQIYNNSDSCKVINDTTFIDSEGQEFIIEKPYTQIISLYSAHTENLYTIGASDQILGVSYTSIYPSEAAFLPRFDYRADPEPLIAMAPDLVIIRPFINRNYPDYVSAIKKAGIEVVSLYPDSEDQFKTYVRILGMITGHEEQVEEQIIRLDESIKNIQTLSGQVPEDEKKSVYFEATKTSYRTVTVDSNPGKAIVYAGGINIASDVKPLTKGSTIAEFGIERLMMSADDIDVYVSQRGAMNSGGSLISIPQREGFKAIKAVIEGNILELNEKLISSPTFRYDIGVREIARMLYPDIFDDLEEYKNDDLLTREVYAHIVVKAAHLPIFVPSSSHYYEKGYNVHTYGLFKDIPFTDESYNEIETAVINSLIKGYKDDSGNEYFDKEGKITKEDIAKTIYILFDITSSDINIAIQDLDLCENPKIIQKIVDNGYMSLNEIGYFEPDKVVTQNEAINYVTIAVEKDNEN